jgi:hypothetical protein
MATNRPIVCPVLVGRGQELRTLAGCLDELEAGRGGVLLVAGEAGVGKTRLVAELQRMAAARGVRLLVGHSFENDRTAPYAPLIDLLRAFAPGPTPEARRAPSTRPPCWPRARPGMTGQSGGR